MKVENAFSLYTASVDSYCARGQHDEISVAGVFSARKAHNALYLQTYVNIVEARSLNLRCEKFIP